MLTTFLAWGIFSIHQIKKKVKKRPEPKKIFYPKISYVMSISHAKEFLKSILFFNTGSEQYNNGLVSVYVCLSVVQIFRISLGSIKLIVPSLWDYYHYHFPVNFAFLASRQLLLCSKRSSFVQWLKSQYPKNTGNPNILNVRFVTALVFPNIF